MITHRCPGPECRRQVPADRLACPRHRYQVPTPARNRVWATWRDGEGKGTEQHAQAMAEAIRCMAMTCTACGHTIRRNDARWLLPGWPNPWNTQTPAPFCQDCYDQLGQHHDDRAG